MAFVWDENEWQDIGGGVEITYCRDEDSGQAVALIERHTCTEGRLSRGYVPFIGADSNAFPGPSRWSVEQTEPLTLSPSIACHTCPNHGWIRNGQWVGA